MVKFMILAFKEVLIIKILILCEIKVLKKFMEDPYSNPNSGLSVSTRTVSWDTKPIAERLKVILLNPALGNLQ